ncbi:Htaa domain protein OS=Streptomyces cyaneofuscatus OX=66883 GN=G3I52_05990 PE=4 SV=1 [Streptomyces cyaneofuscatus]
MVSKERGTGKVSNRSQVPLATLGLGGINMKGGSTPIALTNVPTTLTAQGASAFAGYYTAGTPLDPISLSVDTEAPAEQPKPAPSATKEEDAQKAEDEKKKDAEKAKDKEKAGRFEDAAVDWGVRRTFREYVTGSIGQGKWTLADGAQDGGALFRFPQGKGTYDAKKQTLDADFGGSIHFTGAHDLDLKFAGVTVAVTKGEGTLSADVTSAGTTRKDVPLITFTAKDFAPKEDLAVLTEVPATLTEDGAKAFGSMYKAGTEIDPSRSPSPSTTRPSCPLPDLGSEPTAAAGPTAKPSAEPSAAPASSQPRPTRARAPARTP